MKTPLVSICCLTYNHENYIAECLDGFIMQKTDFDYEILIHDDASTDGTAAIIREYELRYPEIIKPIYQIENQYSKGIKPTFKYNFPRARGKYIALCEGDDYWSDPLKLQKQVDFLEANEECSGCFHEILVLDEKGNEIPKAKFNIREERIDQRSLKRISSYIPTSTLLFRNITSNLPASQDLVTGDIYLHSFLGTFGDMGFVPSIRPSIYRVHLGGIWSSKSDLKKQLQLKKTYIGLIKLHENLKNKSEVDYFRKRIQEKITPTIYYHAIRERNKLIALRYYFKLARFHGLKFNFSSLWIDSKSLLKLFIR